ncbi:MAG: hypothetical protein JW822_06705 [Spirochaetales bacterium]|nr:hypothetical protein [Spirochaetales bacterium]
MKNSRYLTVFLIVFCLISLYTAAAQEEDCTKGPTVVAKNGTVFYATFAKPWTDPKTGIVYEADKKHTFKDE